mmetsp:Transcript_33360/g.80667  ORF Transcript_33360/g.80667 Transcript_33360/m.80667 type:complete len:1201 (+) Transcript_33360:13-3615(+)
MPLPEATLILSPSSNHGKRYHRRKTCQSKRSKSMSDLLTQSEALSLTQDPTQLSMATKVKQHRSGSSSSDAKHRSSHRPDGLKSNRSSSTSNLIVSHDARIRQSSSSRSPQNRRSSRRSLNSHRSSSTSNISDARQSSLSKSLENNRTSRRSLKSHRSSSTSDISDARQSSSSTSLENNRTSRRSLNSHRSSSTSDDISDARQSSSKSLENNRTSRRSLQSHKSSSTSDISGSNSQQPSIPKSLIHYNSRRSLKSHRSSSASDMSDVRQSSSKSLEKNRTSRRSLNKGHRSSSTSDISNASQQPSIPKSLIHYNSRRSLKSHRSSSASDISDAKQSSSSKSSKSAENHRSSRRSLQSHPDSSSKSVDISDNARQTSHSSSKSRKSHTSFDRSPSMTDLIAQTSKRISEVPVDEPLQPLEPLRSPEQRKSGFSNVRQIYNFSSSLSDISFSGTDSDGFENDDLSEFFNSSGALSECFNSSGGDLGVIVEDKPIDGSFEIEFCLNDDGEINSNEGRDMGPKRGSSRRSMSSTVTEEERFRASEAFMSYTLAEKAALQIQRNFRQKKQEKLEQQEDAGLQKEQTDTDEEKGSCELEKELEKQEGNEKNWYTMIMWAIIGTFQTIVSVILCCSSGSDVPQIDAALNTVGGVGGGGGAAPPPGLEAMAGQAAGAASGSAGTGVTAGASAGAAAGATTGAASAAGAAATTATATSQVVTAVAVTASVATVASTTGILTPDVTEPLMTRCGLADPQNRIGKFAMVFEGFPRTLDDRESLLMEGLVLDAYNDLTIGENLTVTGICLDPLSREMQGVEIKNQTYVPLPDGSSFLEVFFEATIVCDKCSIARPLFKNEKEPEVVKEEAQQNATNDSGADEQQQDKDETTNPEQNGTRLLRNDRNQRRLEDQAELVQDQLEGQAAAFDTSGAQFFQRLIQKVVFETEELSNVGELPEGFVSVSEACVTPTPVENRAVDKDEVTAANASTEVDDALKTTVKYRKQDGKGAFEFSYVDEESGNRVTEVVVSDPTESVLNPIPSTPFPAFGPTNEPTISPTTNPTINFSGQPTLLPSVGPTDLPSPVPTDSPSDHPTINFSGQPTFEPSSNPSTTPSESPSDPPSMVPSESPSMAPSYVPSTSPSSTPSIIPSDAPSVAPSVSPSDVPSVIPSTSPSVVPSIIPSDAPSYIPSAEPSDIPSVQPMEYNSERQRG